MKLNFQKLRAKIIEKYGTLGKFAEAYGISENSLSRKMNNKVPFSCEDIIKISGMLDIDKADIVLYFFTDEV